MDCRGISAFTRVFDTLLPGNDGGWVGANRRWYNFGTPPRTVRPSETTNGDGFRYRGKKRSLCCGVLDYPARMSSIAIGGFADKEGYPDEQSRGQQGHCRPLV